MSMFQKVRLADLALLDGALPLEIAAWQHQGEAGLAALANPAEALEASCPPEWDGLGWWPVMDDPLPACDDVTETAVEDRREPDAEAKVVHRRWRVVERADAAEQLASFRSGAVKAIAEHVRETTEHFMPSWRVAAYAEKARQAREVLGGGSAGETLTQEAAERGIAVQDLALQVMAKAEAYDRASGKIERAKIAAERVIAAGAPPAIRSALDWARAAFAAIRVGEDVPPGP